MMASAWSLTLIILLNFLLFPPFEIQLLMVAYGCVKISHLRTFWLWFNWLYCISQISLNDPVLSFTTKKVPSTNTRVGPKESLFAGGYKTNFPGNVLATSILSKRKIWVHI